VQAEDRYASLKGALKAFNKMDLDKLISSVWTTKILNHLQLNVGHANSLPLRKAALWKAPNPPPLVFSRCYICAQPSRISLHLLGLLKAADRLCFRPLARYLPLHLYVVHDFHTEVPQMVSDARLVSMGDVIQRSLNEDAAPGKVSRILNQRQCPKPRFQSGLSAINARVYAVKANCNPLLDVARETYKENVGDIYALCRTLSERHNLPIQPTYQDGAGGFVFSLKKTDMDEVTELPPGFLNVSHKRERVFFSSLELVCLVAYVSDLLA
jgi:hypothetical protein